MQYIFSEVFSILTIARRLMDYSNWQPPCIGVVCQVPFMKEIFIPTFKGNI